VSAVTHRKHSHHAGEGEFESRNDPHQPIARPGVTRGREQTLSPAKESRTDRKQEPHHRDASCGLQKRVHHVRTRWLTHAQGTSSTRAWFEWDRRAAVDLLRFHGVFAPHATFRPTVTLRPTTSPSPTRKTKPRAAPEASGPPPRFRAWFCEKRPWPLQGCPRRTREAWSSCVFFRLRDRPATHGSGRGPASWSGATGRAMACDGTGPGTAATAGSAARTGGATALGGASSSDTDTGATGFSTSV
jgi:hypothetical protein